MMIEMVLDLIAGNLQLLIGEGFETNSMAKEYVERVQASQQAQVGKQ
jgi:hypothetical protein